MVFHCLTFLYRPKNCFLLTITVTLVFLMYQLFSVGQLGKELNRRKLQTNFRSYEKADAIMPHKSNENKYKAGSNTNKYDGSNHIRGALIENWKFYTPSDRRTFTCINSKEEIEFSMVNDNFCDCSDFSDEPSTSACNFGRFYCTYQSKNGPADIISYKVNDGICDCCDGSDEWEHITLPIHTGLPAKLQTGVYQVPCSFRCLK